MAACATLAVATGALSATSLSAATAVAASTSAVPGTIVSSESSPYGTVLMAGSGTFAGYSLYAFTRNTPSACTTTTVTVMGQPLSCAGTETDKTADWPALTTTGKPVAGPGVNKRLLGMVYRKDIGADQVTYGGQLLYLFDPKPAVFYGVNYLETVSPLPPWHGLWRLVAAKNGLPAVGPIPISTQAGPDGKTILAAAMFQGVGTNPIVVYTYSKDTKDHSTCTGTCAVDWPPVLTTAPPQAGTGVTGKVGELKRADGTTQLTYGGKPLYFYSEEVPQLTPTGSPANPATTGSGNGLSGPGHRGSFTVVAAGS
jgi:predicted lipoprotein with Yx(FWY)xxD motif